MLSLNIYDYFSKQDMYNMISKFLYEVIDENIPYVSYALNKPLPAIYSDKNCEQSSTVKMMTHSDLKYIKSKLITMTDAEMFSKTKLQELLSYIKIDRWKSIITSHYSRYWITYEDLLEEKFIVWKTIKLDCYELYEEEDYLELDILMDGAYDEFFESVSYELYYYKILKKLENTL